MTPPVIRADVMTYGATNFTDYLAAKRTKATVAASPTLSNDEVAVYVKDEFLKLGGSAVQYQYLGDDSAGAPVFQLGSIFLLQNIATQLDALVDAGTITQVPGADRAYSANPHLRK